MAPEARSKFSIPIFEPKIFQKHIYCIEGCTCGLFRTFQQHPHPFGTPAVIQCPHSDSVPGELCPPCPPRYAPGCIKRNIFWNDSNHQFINFINTYGMLRSLYKNTSLPAFLVRSPLLKLIIVSQWLLLTNPWTSSCTAWPAALRSSAAKQWLEELVQKMKKL